MYQVELEKFYGPFDLLLQLIESNDLDICEISLASITDQYLSEIEKIEGSPKDLVEFVFIATKLLYLKSKELLPDIINEADEQDIKDLERDLLEYQKYKKAADTLSEILDKGERAYTRKTKIIETKSFFPPKDVNQEKLWLIFNEVFNKAKEDQIEEKTYGKNIISLSEIKNKLRNIITSKKKVYFRSLFAEINRLEIIVVFLAILELIKQNEISFKQDKNFSDFVIYHVE